MKDFGGYTEVDLDYIHHNRHNLSSDLYAYTHQLYLPYNYDLNGQCSSLNRYMTDLFVTHCIDHYIKADKFTDLSIDIQAEFLISHTAFLDNLLLSTSAVPYVDLLRQNYAHRQQQDYVVKFISDAR